MNAIALSPSNAVGGMNVAESSPDACSPSPCLNGARACIATSAVTYACNCSEGFGGDICEGKI
jgi:hypothetical protein